MNKCEKAFFGFEVSMVYIQYFFFSFESSEFRFSRKLFLFLAETKIEKSFSFAIILEAKNWYELEKC